MDTEVKNADGTADLPMDWREMKASELAKLCKAVMLPTSRKRGDLIMRLDRYYHGSSTHHIHGKTLCPYCKANARCAGTRRMSDTLIRRTFRCQGKRRHSFTLDEAIGGRPGAAGSPSTSLGVNR